MKAYETSHFSIERAEKKNLIAQTSKTEERIKNGLSKPNASTGTPIEELHGAARFVANLSNIGGGSLETGGGGMREGLETLLEYQACKTQLNCQNNNEPIEMDDSNQDK